LQDHDRGGKLQSQSWSRESRWDGTCRSTRCRIVALIDATGGLWPRRVGKVILLRATSLA
jgi:hypothetical protein